MTTKLAAQAHSFAAHRLAVSVMFFLNGTLVGGWAATIPTFKDKHQLAESELGLMLLLVGVGSLLTMPFTGAIIAQRGSAGILRLVALLCAFALPFVLTAPNLVMAIAAMLFFGASLGSMDVAMNANAARVEANHRHAIMSSCHGFWSLGALLGATLGGVLLTLVGLVGHAMTLGLVMLAAALYAGPGLMQEDAQAPEESTKPKLMLPRALAIYLIALTALAAFAAEGAVLDWAALYLRDERGVAPWMASYAFAAVAGTMAIVRFLGDPIRMRLGDVRTFQISAALALTGFLLAGVSASLGLIILGFALAGLGLANLVPIAFAAAERMPGLPPGIGISVATFCGYAGLLVAPPLIGFAAEKTSYAVIVAALALLPLYCLVVARKIPS